MGQDGTMDEAILREIVRRIVDVAEPDRVVLFGSAANGLMRANSDVDVLVVKQGAHRRRLAADIYRRLIGVGVAVDVVVVTPEDVEQYGNSSGSVIEPAIRQGRVVYAS